MIDSEKKAFKELMDGISQMFQKEPLTVMALRMYFELLADYDYPQVEQAAFAYLKTPSGQFFPKPADFVRMLEGGDITSGEIIAQAKLAQTPLGILSRIQIGTWDLDNGDPFYLNQRAEEVKILLPEWSRLAAAGDYTDHHISIMIKYDVDPGAPFAGKRLKQEVIDKLHGRSSFIQGTSRHKFLMTPTDAPIENSEVIPLLTNEKLTKG